MTDKERCSFTRQQIQESVAFLDRVADADLPYALLLLVQEAGHLYAHRQERNPAALRTGRNATTGDIETAATVRVAAEKHTGDTADALYTAAVSACETYADALHQRGVLLAVDVDSKGDTISASTKAIGIDEMGAAMMGGYALRAAAVAVDAARQWRPLHKKKNADGGN